MTMYETWCVEGNRVGPVLPVPPPILAQECSSEVTPHRLEPVPPAKRTTDDAKIDAEFDRFAAVAEPTPNGQGWYDPINGTPEIPSGVPIEDWRAFEKDCGSLGKRSKS